MTKTATINEILASEIKEVSEEDLLSVYGGSGWGGAPSGGGGSEGISGSGAQAPYNTGGGETCTAAGLATAIVTLNPVNGLRAFAICELASVFYG